MTYRPAGRYPRPPSLPTAVPALAVGGDEDLMTPADWQYRKAAHARATDLDGIDVDEARAIYRESSGAWVPAWIFVRTDVADRYFSVTEAELLDYDRARRDAEDGDGEALLRWQEMYR